MKPPQHSATAPIQFISISDEAWDERWVAEVNEASEDEAAEHPVGKYFRGETRYDLDATCEFQGEVSCARDYIRPDKTPTVWTLRRPRATEASGCRDMGGALGKQQAFGLAARSVSGPQVTTIPMKGARSTLTAKQIDSLADKFGMKVIWEVGEAALRAAEAPSLPESTRSDS